MDSQKAVQLLQEAGLATSSGNESRFLIAQPDVNGKVSFPAILSLFIFIDNVWLFRNWHAVPGPGPEDFVYQSESLEVIVKTVLNFYFGEPITLNKWIFPVHKHPEWDAERLPIVLETAKQISVDEWKLIRSSYSKRRWEVSWEEPLIKIFDGCFARLLTGKTPISRSICAVIWGKRLSCETNSL